MNTNFNASPLDGRESMSPFDKPESPIPDDIAEAFLDLQRNLSKELDDMTFTDPVTHIYNPMNYAYAAHQNYVKRFCTEQKKILFLGMNPGPYGMAQTGVCTNVTVETFLNHVSDVMETMHVIMVSIGSIW